MKMSTYRKWALCFLGMNLMFVPSLVFAQRNDEATEQLGKALEYFTSQKYHECLITTFQSDIATSDTLSRTIVNPHRSGRCRYIREGSIQPYRISRKSQQVCPG